MPDASFLTTEGRVSFASIPSMQAPRASRHRYDSVAPQTSFIRLWEFVKQEKGAVSVLVALSPALKIGEIINVKNGVDASDLKTVQNNYVGQTVIAVVIPDGQHSGTTQILGFAKVVIVAVDLPKGATKE